jgi:hypothetical protein
MAKSSQEVGRPPSVRDANMKQMAQSLEVELGKTYTGSDVELIIKKKQVENVEIAGFNSLPAMVLREGPLSN